MEAVVVVPGIMGTELLLPRGGGRRAERVWPPTPLETQMGYRRRDKLASPLVEVGKIIRNVLCFEFYRPLLEELERLGFGTAAGDKRQYEFPYDWRRDLFETAAKLAELLDQVTADGATRISLVAHSMGGLVCRLLLEDDTYRSRPWLAAIGQFIAIATPHIGAPLALARVLGRDSAMGISGEDFAWLSGHEAYPSAYQLLPAPGEAACWDQSDEALAPLDIYSKEGAVKLGLNAQLLGRAVALHAVLGRGNAPASVRYFYFAGTGHRTGTRINIFTSADGSVDPERTMLTRTIDGGDGTVPIYSALPCAGQRHIATNEHATAFAGQPFHRVFVRLLGGNAGPALERFEMELAISVESPVITVGDEIEVLLFAANAVDDASGGMTRVEGNLVLRRVGAGTMPIGADVQRIEIAYAGPPVDRFRLYLPSVREPGHYELSFDGRPASSATAMFSACRPLQLRTTVAAAADRQARDTHVNYE